MKAVTDTFPGSPRSGSRRRRAVEAIVHHLVPAAAASAITLIAAVLVLGAHSRRDIAIASMSRHPQDFGASRGSSWRPMHRIPPAGRRRAWCSASRPDRSPAGHRHRFMALPSIQVGPAPRPLFRGFLTMVFGLIALAGARPQASAGLRNLLELATISRALLKPVRQWQCPLLLRYVIKLGQF